LQNLKRTSNLSLQTQCLILVHYAVTDGFISLITLEG